MIGLDVFKKYFRDYSAQYVLLGGAACDILFEELDTAFRGTKDLDTDYMLASKLGGCVYNVNLPFYSC
jgi:hypothetical protein